ncbi:MAG TPA: TIGR03905 family TSCPD domain-containing protein [Clostridiales bacterium]|nr:TIGR03905 family TSCPD domain-containing protein [Clostridiales bacterium]
MYSYKPKGVCSSKIDFDIDDGIVKGVKFSNGCKGNLEALGKLVEGMPVDEVCKRLKGISCQNGTSCADQLVKALEKALSENE